MKQYLYFIILLFVVSCGNSKECVDIVLNNTKESIYHNFTHSFKTNKKYDATIRYKFNDTMLFDGTKVPPMDTLIILKKMEYFYQPGIADIVYNISNYNATEIDISISYCFY